MSVTVCTCVSVRSLQMADMDELFTFGNTRRAKVAIGIGGALRNAAKNSKVTRHSLNLSSSGEFSVCLHHW